MWITLAVFVLGLGLNALIIEWDKIDEFDEEDVRGKRVFVTGASTGIGEQLAYEFCRLGADVVITARREAALKQVAEKCRRLGRPDGKYFYLAADMSDLNSIGPLVQEASRRLGGLDYIVPNHKTPNTVKTWTGSADDFMALDRKLVVNFKSYVHLATHAMSELEKSQGRIVVVSSISGKIGQPFFAAYSTSKFALNGFFSSLRQDLIMIDSPVSVTVAILGLMDTEHAIFALKELGLKFPLKDVRPSLTDAARAIIAGGAKRRWEVFFPYMEIRMMTLFRDWFPQTLSGLTSYFAQIYS